jgi:hypothetical protein
VPPAALYRRVHAFAIHRNVKFFYRLRHPFVEELHRLLRGMRRGLWPAVDLDPFGRLRLRFSAAFEEGLVRFGAPGAAANRAARTAAGAAPRTAAGAAAAAN